MANYEIAESITGRNEGLYANNPSDTGGETIMGIARNHWPKWSGWAYIDKFKLQYKEYVKGTKNPISLTKWINGSVTATPEVAKLSSKFYKENFWDINKLDQFKDQQVANSVYDFGVNSGTGRAAKFLQEVLGVEADGKIGSITLEKLNKSDAKKVLTEYNAKRETAYKSWAKGNQAQFLKSWLSRLKPYK